MRNEGRFLAGGEAQLRWAAIRVALEAGRLGEARQLLPTTQGEARRRLVRAQLGLLQGSWSRLADEIAAAQRLSVTRDRPVIFHALAVLSEELALLTAAQPAPLPSNFSGPGPILAARASTLRVRRGVRAGALAPAAVEAALSEASRYQQSAVQGALLQADQRAMLRLEAAPDLEEAASEARRAGAAVDEALLRELLLDACLLEERPQVERHASRLEELARSLESRRFSASAAWARLACGPAPAADEIGKIIDESPEGHPAARRCRALLGAGATLDGVDLRVASRVEARWGWPGRAAAARLVAFEEQRSPRLTLDLPRRTVRVGEQEIDLSARPLFLRILSTLIRRGGFASKEQLALEAWEQPTYSPLRDDNRIQVAIGRLRRSLCLPALLAHGDGYALEGGHLLERSTASLSL